MYVEVTVLRSGGGGLYSNLEKVYENKQVEGIKSAYWRYLHVEYHRIG